MQSRLSSVGFLLLVVACGGGDGAAPGAEAPPQQSEQESAALTEEEIDRALSLAREARARAETIRAPEYDGDDSAEDSLEYISGDLMRWVARRSAAQQLAVQAYGAVADSVPPPELSVQVLWELADMQLAFAEEFVKAGMTSEPSAVADDPNLHERFEQSLRTAIAPQTDEARDALVSCAKLADEHGVQSEAVKRCRSRLEQLGAPSQ